MVVADLSGCSQVGVGQSTCQVTPGVIGLDNQSRLKHAIPEVRTIGKLSEKERQGRENSQTPFVSRQM